MATKQHVSGSELQPGETYEYLEHRTDTLWREMFVKGKKLAVAHVVRSMWASERTEEEMADDYRIPVEAVREALLYYERHPDIIALDIEDNNRAAERMATYRGPTPLPRRLS